MQITWLGHNCWQIETGDQKLLLDPFLDDSPTAPVKASEVEADFVLISHGHFDHVGDVLAIAERTGAVVIANYEITKWLQAQGVAEEKVMAMNLGGGIQLPVGRVEMTIAHHSSMLPDGSNGGSPAGFLMYLEGKAIYFACDTGLFLDMKVIGVAGLELAVLPIGDRFTMGPAESLEAIKLLAPKQVVPCHYSTWPLIEQDVEAWAKCVQEQTAAEPVLLAPGESISL